MWSLSILDPLFPSCSLLALIIPYLQLSPPSPNPPPFSATHSYLTSIYLFCCLEHYNCDVINMLSVVINTNRSYRRDVFSKIWVWACCDVIRNSQFASCYGGRASGYIYWLCRLLVLSRAGIHRVKVGFCRSEMWGGTSFKDVDLTIDLKIYN